MSGFYDIFEEMFGNKKQYKLKDQEFYKYHLITYATNIVLVPKEAISLDTLADQIENTMNDERMTPAFFSA